MSFFLSFCPPSIILPEPTPSTRLCEMVLATQSPSALATQSPSALATQSPSVFVDESSPSALIKLIGQGSYGCVYYPGFTSSGDPVDSSMATKLQLKEFSIEELKISEVVKTIPHYEKMFVPIESYEEVELASIHKDLLKDCKIIQEYLNETEGNDPFLLCHMKYIDSMRLTDSMILKKNVYGTLKNIHRVFVTLLSSVKKLSQKGIVHFDLNKENVIVHRQTMKPMIIDFGLSLDLFRIRALFSEPEWNTEKGWAKCMEQLCVCFYSYSPNYYVWSPEIHLIHYIVSNKCSSITEEELEKISRECVYENDIFCSFSKDTLKQYYDVLLDHFRELVKDHKGDMKILVCSLLIDDRVTETWDLYSLNIMILSIVDIYFGKEGLPMHPYIDGMYSICTQNIHPVPQRRHTIDETFALLEKNWLNMDDVLKQAYAAV